MKKEKLLPENNREVSEKPPIDSNYVIGKFPTVRRVKDPFFYIGMFDIAQGLNKILFETKLTFLKDMSKISKRIALVMENPDTMGYHYKIKKRLNEFSYGYYIYYNLISSTWLLYNEVEDMNNQHFLVRANAVLACQLLNNSDIIKEHIEEVREYAEGGVCGKK